MKAATLLLGAGVLLIPALCGQAPRAAVESPEAAQAKRERALKMPEIIQALGLKSGSRVADIGAGDGEYEVALARVVADGGRVFAEDINAGSIQRLRELVEHDHLGNVEVIEGTAADPKLPAGSLDGVLMVITYHEIADHETMLEHVRASLKPGGRLVVVDMPPHKTLTRPRADQTKNHVIAADLVQAEVQKAGFEVVSREDRFVDLPDEESTKWMIVFRKTGS
jgi:ubiquinone/menaquinone biosynthesis C-methylase UbiE